MRLRCHRNASNKWTSIATSYNICYTDFLLFTGTFFIPKIGRCTFINQASQETRAPQRLPHPQTQNNHFPRRWKEIIAEIPKVEGK
jgi:hypothetical protein